MSRVQRLLLPAALPGLHALLSPAVVHAFDTLRLGASLWDEEQWHALHVPPLNVAIFEPAHGKETERDRYNMKLFAQARRERRTVRGTLAGFSDLFVPIVAGGNVYAVLVTGPFATARATSEDILSRWQWITGRTGHLSEPEFAYYVSLTLETLVLERESLEHFEKMLQCFALLCVAQGDARTIAREAGEHRAKLDALRFPEVMWEAVRTMVDESTAQVWLSPHRRYDIRAMGLSRLPEQVLVCQMLGRSDEPDPLAELLRRDAFQRACVELARAEGEVISGRFGERGVIFLLSEKRGAAQRLVELSQRVAKLGRRFGLTARAGASSLLTKAALSAKYEEALGAAELALLRGASLVVAEPGQSRAATPLRALRRVLGASGHERPETLLPRFERYLQAVGAQFGYRPDLIRVELEGGFEQAAQGLLPSDVREERAVLDLYETLDRRARDAASVSELFTAYRRGIAELVAMAEHPSEAGRKRSLQRATQFIDRHFAEPLTLAQVSRIAGLAPAYFCRQFKKRQGVTFERYVRHLRIDRGRQLLTGTDLSIERIALMSGFSLRQHFHRAFKKSVGVTPVACRKRGY